MPKWKFKSDKIGAHVIHRNGQRIRLTPADGVFEAEEHELLGARDKFLNVETQAPPLPKSPVIKEQDVAPDDFLDLEVVPAGKGWYDVIDSNGKKINDKKLRWDEATTLVGGANNAAEGSQREADTGEEAGAEEARDSGRVLEPTEDLAGQPSRDRRRRTKRE